jgi:hypothetical protein
MSTNPQFLTLYDGQLMAVTESMISRIKIPGSVLNKGGWFWIPAKTYLYNPKKNSNVHLKW